MVPAELLQSLGLFVQRGFFDSSRCLELKSTIEAAPSHAGKVFRTPTDEALVDSTRRVLSAALPAETIQMVRDQFLAIRPRLEAHFGLRLDGCEPPSFLVYDVGAHYTPHYDTGDWLAPPLRKRRVSVVAFLNGHRSAADDGFDGGALTFYGLLGEADAESVGLPLQPEAGLLVAFRAETLHEVQPVTAGRRFTIVTWFLGDDPSTTTESN